MKRIVLIIIFCLPAWVKAETLTDKALSETDKKIEEFLITAPKNIHERYEHFFLKLKDTKYRFRTFGEGPDGDIQTAPLYQLTTFDCITFIETYLSLIYSKDLNDFKKNILKIRYTKLPPKFNHRAHFVETDWLPQLLKEKFVTDINSKISKQKPSELEGEIDKPKWYLRIPEYSIQPTAVPTEELQKRLSEISKNEKVEKFKMKYISRDHLKRVMAEKKNFPEYAVAVFIYKPIVEMSAYFGADNYVRHVGIIKKEPAQLVMRSASAATDYKKTSDQSLEEYIEKCLKEEGFMGVSFYKLKDT